MCNDCFTLVIMSKTALINTRIDPQLKKNAESILKKVGITSAEAIRMFYKHICIYNGIPFRLRMPNEETIIAMRDADSGNTYSVNSVDEIFKDLN